MKSIVKAYNYILNAMAVIAGILIFAAFVMIVVDVLMRITGLKPPLFTIAVVEYILLWLRSSFRLSSKGRLRNWYI